MNLHDLFMHKNSSFGTGMVAGGIQYIHKTSNINFNLFYYYKLQFLVMLQMRIRIKPGIGGGGGGGQGIQEEIEPEKAIMLA